VSATMHKERGAQKKGRKSHQMAGAPREHPTTVLCCTHSTRESGPGGTDGPLQSHAILCKPFGSNRLGDIYQGPVGQEAMERSFKVNRPDISLSTPANELLPLHRTFGKGRNLCTHRWGISRPPVMREPRRRKSIIAPEWALRLPNSLRPEGFTRACVL